MAESNERRQAEAQVGAVASFLYHAATIHGDIEWRRATVQDGPAVLYAFVKPYENDSRRLFFNVSGRRVYMLFTDLETSDVVPLLLGLVGQADGVPLFRTLSIKGSAFDSQGKEYCVLLPPEALDLLENVPRSAETAAGEKEFVLVVPISAEQKALADVSIDRLLDSFETNDPFTLVDHGSRHED